MREITGVQNPVIRYARSRGWLCWKMTIEGRNGCPDYWCFKDGVTLIIEFKAPGKPRRRQQELRAKELSDQGFDVHVIDNPETGRALFD